MSLFSKVNVCLILIAMVFALVPTATYAAAYIKFDGIGGKIPEMRVTEKTTVNEVAVFAARHAGVDVGCISLSWRGQEIWGQRRTGSSLLGNHIIMGPDADVPAIVISQNSNMGGMCEWTDIRDRPQG